MLGGFLCFEYSDADSSVTLPVFRHFASFALHENPLFEFEERVWIFMQK